MEAAVSRTAVSGVKCHMTSFMIIHYYKTFLLQKWRRDDWFWVLSSFYCPLDICLNQLNIRSGGKCGFLLWPKKAFTLYSRPQEVKHQSRLDRLDLRSSSQPLWKAQLLLTRCSPRVFILLHCLLFIRSFTAIEMRSLKSKPEIRTRAHTSGPRKPLRNNYISQHTLMLMNNCSRSPVHLPETGWKSVVDAHMNASLARTLRSWPSDSSSCPQTPLVLWKSPCRWEVLDWDSRKVLRCLHHLKHHIKLIPKSSSSLLSYLCRCSFKNVIFHSVILFSNHHLSKSKSVLNDLGQNFQLCTIFCPVISREITTFLRGHLSPADLSCDGASDLLTGAEQAP